jgi:hypothetical protein
VAEASEEGQGPRRAVEPMMMMMGELHPEISEKGRYFPKCIFNIF